MRLSDPQKYLLAAMAQGAQLKDRRDIEGNKSYILRNADGSDKPIAPADVETLVNAGLISSNKKFPVATYWLTEAGKRLPLELAGML
jgi:hypothetical protein